MASPLIYKNRFIHVLIPFYEKTIARHEADSREWEKQGELRLIRKLGMTPH